MEWWSTLLSVVGLILALLLVGSIVYVSWRNGISPLPASPLLLREVEREVREAIQRIDIVQREQQSKKNAVEIVNGRSVIANGNATRHSHTNANQNSNQNGKTEPAHFSTGHEATVASTVDTEVHLALSHPLKLVEAGSGWGTLAIHLKRHVPALHVIGIENSPVPYVVSRGLAWLRRSRIALIRGDLYQYDYRDTDLIVCYLFPGAMKRLSTLWREQCRQDTYIISIYFALPGWEPEHMITCRDIHRTRIYIYRAGHRSYVV